MIFSLLRSKELRRMVVYTVHEPPLAPADVVDRSERLVFVKDGFIFLAAMLPPLWFATKRMWLALVAYFIAVAAIVYTLKWLGYPEQDATIATLALNFIAGFEADALYRWHLARKGWRMLGAVTGRNENECERRFFDLWLPTQPVIALPKSIAPQQAPIIADLAPSAASASDGRRGWWPRWSQA